MANGENIRRKWKINKQIDLYGRPKQIRDMEKVYFITGIDTNVGKSIATGFLAKEMMNKGLNVMTQKLIQTGNDEVSEDIEMHRKLMGLPLLPDDLDRKTCPYIFSYPCSPHLASAIDKQPIELDIINKCTDYLTSKYDVVLLEGAGGIMVPIHENYLTIDFIRDQNYPVILVTSPKLGSLNHTLLTIEACQNRGIHIDQIVYNNFPEESDIIGQDTFNYLQRYIEQHRMDTQLIRVPYLKELAE